MTELDLGASASDTGTWKTQYEYGELQSNGTVDSSKNTGNIARQTLSFNGITHPLVQSYKYDALYRITEATETSNNVANWFQVWGYDRYGNRTSFTQNIGGNPASSNPTIDVNTNRFNADQGFGYDKNGNVTSNVDPITSLNRTFLFNGDNKQYEVKDANGTTTARYYYDGEGKRVKKKNEITDETTIFVYSSGKLVAEYSTVTPPATPTVNYTTTDHLGSPRVITDAIGQVTSRRDFLPFGEEVTINVGSRSPALKYGSSDDKVRQKFTGYQKDTETSLDFAEARMYDNRFGRFTAVDPLLASGKSIHPQTFNRFVYTGNNPIARTDPTGEDWIVQITKVKIKEQRKVDGRVKTIEKTINVRTPTYVGPDEEAGKSRIDGIWEVNQGGNGFQALHPTKNIASDVFSKREDAEAVYNGWLLNDQVKFVDSGQGLPSEQPENQEAIRSRISFMLNSSECNSILRESRLSTPRDVLANRGLTIADPEVLRRSDSTSIISGGFDEKARLRGLNSLDNNGAQAFTLRPNPYSSQPRGRVFTFFTPGSFGREWFGFGRPRLNEDAVHEIGMHGGGADSLPRPQYSIPFTVPFSHDLSVFPRYDEIIQKCSPR